jgi:hypothetical protein
MAFARAAASTRPLVAARYRTGSGSDRVIDSYLEGLDRRVTLAALAHPGLQSVAAPRLVDADSRVAMVARLDRSRWRASSVRCRASSTLRSFV